MDVVSANRCDSLGEHFRCAHHDAGDVGGLVDSAVMAAFVNVVCVDTEFVRGAMAGFGRGMGVCFAGWLGIARTTNGGNVGDLVATVTVGGREFWGAGVVFCALGCAVV